MAKRKWLILILTAVIVAAAIIVSGVCRKKPDSATGPVAAGTESAAAGVSSGEAKPRGRLEVKGADLEGHEVREAATGNPVARITAVESTISLPAGTYDVGFGPSFWKGVVVREGETTVLEPGGLTLHHASLAGHDVVSLETGIVQGKVGATKSHIVLVPGAYAVKFGPLSWTTTVAAGATTTLDPGLMTVKGADIRGHRILDATGNFVGNVSATSSSLPLPPGDYRIEMDGKVVPFTLAAGQTVTLER